MATRETQRLINSSASDITKSLQLISDLVLAAPSSIGLGWSLALRDLKITYLKSALGILWLVLGPILYAIIFVVVRQGMLGGGLTIEVGDTNPALFALVGIVLFQGWIEGIYGQLETLRKNQNLIKNTLVPPETYFFSALIVNLFGVTARLAVISATALSLGSFEIRGWLEFAGWTLGMALTANAIGSALAFVGNFYPDVRSTIQAMTLALILISPVFYPATSDAGSILYWLNRVNPLAATLVPARNALLGGSSMLVCEGLLWIAVSALTILVMMIANRTVARIVSERMA